MREREPEEKGTTNSGPKTKVLEISEGNCGVFNSPQKISEKSSCPSIKKIGLKNSLKIFLFLLWVTDWKHYCYGTGNIIRIRWNINLIRLLASYLWSINLLLCTQSHYIWVLRWAIFMEQNVRFGLLFDGNFFMFAWTLYCVCTIWILYRLKKHM